MLRHFSIPRLVRKLQAGVIQRTKSISCLFASSSSRRLAVEREIIESSLLFDSHWYVQAYPDVAQAGMDPLHHFLTAGWQEGRDPGPMFTTSAYLKANEDVAKSGANPLLHFVQFGLSEGRDGFGDRHLPAVISGTLTDFAEPHECLSFPRRTDSVAWRRGYGLDREDPRFVAVGPDGAGYADGSARAMVEAGVEWLRLLSGLSLVAPPKDALPWAGRERRLADAWYVNDAQLRTRWSAADLPVVVRAFQCDPWDGGEPRLVGEGAIQSALDVVDLHLLNPYFPILFIIADPSGATRAGQLLGFPSLCRGGTHYPELLASPAAQAQNALDLAEEVEKLTEKLIALICGEADAAVAHVEIDLADADGNGPLFRSDLRRWLNRVMRAEIVAGDDRAHRAPTTPQTLIGSMAARDGGAVLAIPSDAAPTIASLVEHRGGVKLEQGPRPAPLLVSRLDPCEPAILIDVPADAGPALVSKRSELPWLIPRGAIGLPRAFPPAAVRISSSTNFSDSQLLAPTLESKSFSTGARAPITWLFDVEGWDDVQLSQMLETAALQRSAAGDSLALIGSSRGPRYALARMLFRGEAAAFKTWAEAVCHLKTPLAGYIGSGVLLHDHRTADCFASMLTDERVATASCVIVSAEKRGGAIKTKVVDDGMMRDSQGARIRSFSSVGASTELWQGDYPVLRPSPHLWAARSSALQCWSDRSAYDFPAGAVHLYTSVITASLLKGGGHTDRAPAVPDATATAATVEWLVG